MTSKEIEQRFYGNRGYICKVVNGECITFAQHLSIHKEEFENFLVIVKEAMEAVK